MIKQKPNLIPQSLAARVVGRSRQYVASLIKRNDVHPVEVYGEPWVFLSEVRRAIEKAPGRGGRPPKENKSNDPA